MNFKATAITIIALFTTTAFAQQETAPRIPENQEPPLYKPARDVLTNPDHWMAILGDSGSTGAASDVNLKPNLFSILGAVADIASQTGLEHTPPPLSNFPNPERFKIDRVDPMNRVVYSYDEYVQAAKENDIRSLNQGAKASMVLDVQEHSNGYMIGRTLDIRAEDIVLVGQGGARVNAIPRQIARIFEMKTDTLPPLVLMSFTANDFCNPKIFTDPMERLKRYFDVSLQESFDKAERYMIAHPKGTRFVVLAPLDVANILTNEDVLQQTVQFEGLGKISCGQVRRGDTRKTFLSRQMTDSLQTACKAVLQTKPTDTDRLDRIRLIQSEFNEIWKKHIRVLNEKYNSKNIQFEYVESTRDMKFAKGDVANDCFHPGVNGHAKVADHVLKTVFGK